MPQVSHESINWTPLHPQLSSGSRDFSLGMLLTLLGIVLSLLAGWRVAYAESQRQWPTKQGIVRRTFVFAGQGYVRYQYRLKGQLHVDECIVGNGKSGAELETDFPKHHSVTIRYDPDRPGVSTLSPGAGVGDRLWLFATCGLTFVGLLWWALGIRALLFYTERKRFRDPLLRDLPPPSRRRNRHEPI